MRNDAYNLGMAAVVEVDGNLPGALDNLRAAVGKLIDPKKAMNPHGGPVLEAPSLYRQLVNQVPASAGQGDFRGVKRSGLPLWADAFDLLNVIDAAVAAWQSEATDTPSRLRELASRKWRPQDVRGIEQITAAVESWAITITEMIDPPRRWSLPSPCPACGTKVVYRRNSSGERIRQPALGIGPHGCECAHCHTTWSPEKFVWLSRLLGSLPDNVLE